MNERRENSENFKAVASAIERGRLDELQALLDAGAGLNELDIYGQETAFSTGYLWHGGLDEDGDRIEVPNDVLMAIRLGCERGAHFHHEEGAGNNPDQGVWTTGFVLTMPLIQADAQITAMLLLHGLDPNWSNKRDLPSQLLYPGYFYQDSLLSHAIHLYTALSYEQDKSLAVELDQASEDDSLAWIELLDRVAVARNRFRPAILFLLHAFGARERDEYRALINAQPDWQPPPPEDAMALAIAGCKERGDEDSATLLQQVSFLCRLPLPKPPLVRPQFNRDAWKTAVLTSDQILKRRDWTWPMIHRLLKAPDRTWQIVAERKLVKAYHLVRVRAAEESDEFKQAKERRGKRPLPPRQRPPGGMVGTYTPPAIYRASRRKKSKDADNPAE